MAVGLLVLEIQKKKSTLTFVDDTTTARNLCDSIRSHLVSMDTTHFRDQADVAWYGVDRLKSAMNALLNCFDTSAPSKIIEVRNKIQEGEADIAAGIRGINARRKLYGLGPIKV